MDKAARLAGSGGNPVVTDLARQETEAASVSVPDGMILAAELALETGAKWKQMIDQANRNIRLSKMTVTEDDRILVSVEFADWVREQAELGNTGMA